MSSNLFQMIVGIPAVSVLAAGCSLVTVPVETAGGVVKTTVKTAGSVAEAPFKAASSHRGGHTVEE